MAEIDIDMSEVRELAEDMRHVDSRLAPRLKPILEKGALNIKTQLQAEMRKSTHFATVARGISYEDTSTPGEYSYEIGPEKGAPGSLANIAYFGGGMMPGGGTVPDPRGALEAEAPRTMQYLASKAIELMLG